MNFNNVIGEYLKYFFVIDNMSIYKSIVKFIISLTSLIIKSAQSFEKIRIFYKILGLLQRDGAFFVKGKYFLWWGLRPRPKLPRPWAGPSLHRRL